MNNAKSTSRLFCRLFRLVCFIRELKERRYCLKTLIRNPEKFKRTGPFFEPVVTDDVDDVFIGEFTRPEALLATVRKHGKVG
ncbi:hypothetical protein ACFLVM_03040 [Chloroflexota bacterium]